MTQWAQRPTEPAFAAFHDWTDRWLAAPADRRQSLEAEGIALARTRRQAMADLIQGRPERALELAVPSVLAKKLPDAVQSLLEGRFSTRGDYFYANALPASGQEDNIPYAVRAVKIGDQTFRAYTSGDGLSHVTKKNVALTGITLPANSGTNPDPTSLISTPDGVAAIAAEPVRQLDDEEIAQSLAASEAAPTCPTSGDAVVAHAAPTGIEFAGQRQLYCGVGHAASAASWLVKNENLSSAALTISDGEGGTSNLGAPTISNGYTQGYKRMLILRVDFPDYTGEQATISAGSAATLLGDLRTYLHLMSYGTHELAPQGPNGSDYTSVLRMGSNASAYDNDGLGKLYNEARSKATAAGYDLSKYDWFGVFTTGKPAAGYAGLAWVGGVGFHMANGYFSKHVVSHEFGHNLGLPHAHRWDTGGKSVIGTGSQVEYGNPYDPIGATYDGIPGEKHYVGSYKKYLGWIPDADASRAATGFHNLTTSDDAHSTGRRLIRAAKDSRDYWVEFRENLTDTNLRNAVFIQWANTNGNENSILDARPSSSATSIPIGRTFSDPGANGGAGVHITPVGKNGTFPESMKVFVQAGAAAGNAAPTVTLSMSTTGAAVTPSTGTAPTPVTFTATATDANGDTLAYAWDFGDGSISYDNEPVQTHAYSSGGEYPVQVTVSDMKGGAIRKTIIARIDAGTSIYRISGHVLDLANKGIAGLRMTATSGSESHYAYTDSDGSYTLTNLGAKAWTIAGRDELGDGYTFAAPFFTNPITVGPSSTAADFVATAGPTETLTTLIAKKSTWRWFSQGVQAPAGWETSSYSDSAWNSGPGILGYGNDAQDTVIPYGGDDAAKWTTYYFRKSFTIANKALFTGLRLGTMRDDGVVVYLNGVEIWRDNMPAGAVTYATTASDTTEPSAYISTDIDLSHVNNGTNVIAVEVHQANGGSSDMAFDLTLEGVAPVGGSGTSIVAVTSPADQETIVLPAASVTLNAVALVKNQTVNRVDFYVDSVKVGEDTVAPFSTVWNNPAVGSHVLKCVAAVSDGSTETSGNTRVSVVNGPDTSLIAANAAWKYYASSTAPSSSWRQTSFNDASWLSGAAPLGFGDAGLTTITASGLPAVYFRKAFTVVDPTAVQSLTAGLTRDDGAVVYLNGTEVIRNNMPTGTIAHATLAAGAGTHEDAIWTYALPTDLLVPGTNVIAVEVHQSDLTSSDLRFRLSLDATTTPARTRGLTLTGPATVASPTAPVLNADPVAGGTLGITKVDFYEGATKIGTDTSYPFSFTWTGGTIGAHLLTAKATDTAGTTIDGNTISLTILPPVKTTDLVHFGDTWKYLDTGVAPASTWTAKTGFDESAWLSGRAPLGYGGNGEVTVIGFGNETGAKYISTWFRKSFTVSNPAAFSQIRLRLTRDDGAVVYINGVERFRSNLPEGTLLPTTLAPLAMNGADETTPVEVLLPTSVLSSGTNVIAVEVHQASAGSSDLMFDCELAGLANGSSGTLYLTSPAASTSVGVAVDLPLSVYIDPSFTAIARVEYFAGQAKIGETASAPYGLTWTTPLVGSYPIYAKVTHSGGVSSTPAVTITVGQTYLSQELVTGGASWKYLDTGVAPAADWNNTTFVDTTWKSGVSRLGFGADGENTAITSGRTTYWFRYTFTSPSPATFANLILRYQRDDGVAFYLNGHELFRDNLPTGTLTATTLATAGVSAPEETAWFFQTVPTTWLNTGTNVLAAEVHQNAATSSDVGFDAGLVGQGTDAAAIANTQPAAMPLAKLVSSGLPAGQFRFDLPDASGNGRLYLVESSADMKTWQPVSYEFVRSGQIQLPIVQNGPSRYYRARWLSALP